MKRMTGKRKDSGWDANYVGSLRTKTQVNTLMRDGGERWRECMDKRWGK